MTSHVRPWQGTTLAVAYYLLTAYAVFSAVAAVFGLSLLGSISGGFVATAPEGQQAATVISGLLGGLGLFFGIMVLMGALISYLFGRGLWVGKHWPITITVIFAGLALVLALASMDVVSILVTGVPVALAVSIWKDPFYNHAKHV